MNQSQMKYARERIDRIYSEKLRKIEDKCRDQVKVLSTEERIEALKKGAFTVPDYQPKKSYYDINHYVSFDREILFPREQCEAEKKTLNDLKRDVLDELMLGDSEVAMEALKKFASYEV